MRPSAHLRGTGYQPVRGRQGGGRMGEAPMPLIKGAV